METLEELIDALIIITQAALALRFIVLQIQSADMEDQQAAQFKKQRKTIIIALVMVVCVYDIPRLLEKYFGGGI